MTNRIVVSAVLAALLPASAFLLGETTVAHAALPTYERVILVSWDGVRRDVMQQLLEVPDRFAPCWEGGDVYPLDTGRVNTGGDPIYTCLPALAGIKPSDAPDDSPAYGPYQIVLSHTTNDGNTFTKPQHGAMLSGYNTETTGITTNVSKARMPPGMIIYEPLMDHFDPIGPDGRRDGSIFHTHHSADRKFVGMALYYWARANHALQVKTGHGSEKNNAPGPLKHAARSFDRWSEEAIENGLPEPSFFMFLHFKDSDWRGHIAGDQSKSYLEAIVGADLKLYKLMEMLREKGWDDTAVIVTTDHGFGGIQHARSAGRSVFNTWMAARNVHLNTDSIPLRTADDYCDSTVDPATCKSDGPAEPMPDEDVVPNVYVTFVVPTILDMFGVEWRTTTGIEGKSLYVP